MAVPTSYAVPVLSYGKTATAICRLEPYKTAPYKTECVDEQYDCESNQDKCDNVS